MAREKVLVGRTLSRERNSNASSLADRNASLFAMLKATRIAGGRVLSAFARLSTTGGGLSGHLTLSA